MNPTPANYYPNRMGRVIYLAMEEILDCARTGEILHLSMQSGCLDGFPAKGQGVDVPFIHPCRIQAALEKAYGPLVGRGLALRVGRGCVNHSLREFGAELGLTELGFRLQPLRMRVRVGIQALVEMFNDFTDQRVRLEQDENYFYWNIERCPLCLERKADKPVCTLAVGLLQEALCWFSGGKSFRVEEKQCLACDDLVCTIVIDQTPMV